MGTLANSEDPEKMWHNATFHQSLNCLHAKTKLISERNANVQYFFEIITCDPMDYPDLIVSNIMENSIGFKRVKQFWSVSSPHGTVTLW